MVKCQDELKLWCKSKRSAVVYRLCGSRKYPHPSHGRSLEIPRGRGSKQPKFITESMKLNWKFPGGGGGRREGSNEKNLPWGRYGNFLEPHIEEVKFDPQARGIHPHPSLTGPSKLALTSCRSCEC